MKTMDPMEATMTEMDTELVYLINAVMDQITKDVHDGDMTALEEMLAFVPKDKLRGFLPEAYYDE